MEGRGLKPTALGPGLRWVVEACRTCDEDHPLAAFGAGLPTPCGVVERHVPAAILDALRRENLLELAQAPEATSAPAPLASGPDASAGIGTRPSGAADVCESEAPLVLTVSCRSVNGIVSILPARQALDADLVYLNADSVWLLQLAWAHGRPGERAAELGTGNGLVASYLVSRYRSVIATDIHEPSLHWARLTLEANRGRGRPSAVVRCDIGSALRPAAFDLVVANAPWSPRYPQDDLGRTITFADGGPTGTELPARFIEQTIELLAPGGVGIVLALDTDLRRWPTAIGRCPGRHRSPRRHRRRRAVAGVRAVVDTRPARAARARPRRCRPRRHRRAAQSVAGRAEEQTARRPRVGPTVGRLAQLQRADLRPKTTDENRRPTP